MLRPDDEHVLQRWVGCLRGEVQELVRAAEAAEQQALRHLEERVALADVPERLRAQIAEARTRRAELEEAVREVEREVESLRVKREEARKLRTKATLDECGRHLEEIAAQANRDVIAGAGALLDDLITRDFPGRGLTELTAAEVTHALARRAVRERLSNLRARVTEAVEQAAARVQRLDELRRSAADLQARCDELVSTQQGITERLCAEHQVERNVIEGLFALAESEYETRCFTREWLVKWVEAAEQESQWSLPGSVFSEVT